MAQLNPMFPPDLPHHARAVGIDGLQNITIFNNRVVAIHHIKHKWICTEVTDDFGKRWWRAELIAAPISINAGYITNYVGFGLKKAFAKDVAANHYLIVNQVILPPPLTPDSEGGENYI